MKRLMAYTAMVLTIAFIFSCKKQEAMKIDLHATPLTVSYANYSQLKVGNYWIYERFKIEQNAMVTSLNQRDSCYISKDTLIHGQTYFKLQYHDFLFNTNAPRFLRDSLHYIVSSGGAILFSSEDFSSVFYDGYMSDSTGDTICKITQKMNDKDLAVSVPAGKFTTSSMQSTYVMKMYTGPEVNNPRYLNSRYAKNIGLVSETELFYSSANYLTERRLVRYRLN